MSIGEKIITLRTAQDLSQYALAKRAGVSQPTLLDIERGKTTPNVATLEKLCGILGLSLSDFFANDSQSPPPLESELLATFRSLSEEKQEMAIRVIKAL